MDEITWSKVWGQLLTPPAIIIIIGMLGLMLNIWRRWLGGIVIGISLLTLFILSVPVVGKRLLAQTEAPYRGHVAGERSHDGIGAIIILGAGRYTNAPEYGEADTVDTRTLERLRYGAKLATQTGLPILVSGGSAAGEEHPEAELMRQWLEREAATKVKWVENKSRTTLENAVETKKTLAEAGIRKIYLVTHAWHMRRAEWAFVKAGLDVIPAPMGFTTLDKIDLGPLGYVPSSTGLHASSVAFRERFGLYWYQRKSDALSAAEIVRESGK